MKTKLLTTVSGLFLLLLLVAGCQKEELITNDKLDFRAPPPCTPLNDELTYSANPVCLGDEVTIDLTTDATCGQIQIATFTPGDADWVQVVHENPTTDGDAAYTFTPPVTGDYGVRWKYTGSGGGCDFCSTSGGWIEGPALVVENCGCESSLTATLDCNDNAECGRTVTYTFIPEFDGYVEIQGGLSNNTEICAMSATGGLTGVVRDSPNQANVTTWTGDVVACETYTITINWTRFGSGAQNTIDPHATGGWSALLNGVEVATVPELYCD